MALVAPARPPQGSNQGQRPWENFVGDEVGGMVACPQGQAPGWASVRERTLTVRFAPGWWQAGPRRPKCPGAVRSQAPPAARWPYPQERVAPCQRRLAAQEPACIAQ